MSKTVQQKTNYEGFPKPGELIEIRGAHDLEASDRAVLNILYRHAHNSGRISDIGADWDIPLKDLRISNKNNNSYVIDTLNRLMKVVVKVAYKSSEGDEHVLLTHLFDFFDVPTNEGNTISVLKYGIPRKLQPILSQSSHWGRIKAEVVCAMTSKYAMQLYEIIQLRANMEKCVETFTLDQFRQIMNVPPNTYSRGHDLVKYVIEPAILEVNGVSDMGVDLQPRRKHAKAQIYEVAMSWWKKEGDEFRSALRERQRSKIGRMARLRGTVEKIEF
jgi:plasmid replication initiation protein